MILSRNIPGTLFICFLFVFSKTLFSQEDPVEEVENILSPSFDTTYIGDYSSLLTARVYGLFQEAGLISNSSDYDRLSYHPNIPGRLGLAAYYKWFGLGLSLGIPFFDRPEDVYGKTKFYDLRLNLYGNWYAAEVFFQNFKGYYVSGNTTDKTLILPDMHIFSTGAYLYYFRNHEKFSIRAAYVQTERQKKSAGSLVIRPSLLYYSFSSGNGIIPLTVLAQITNKPVEYPVEGYFYSFGLAIGYAHTFVFLKYFYINLAFYPGFYYQFGRYNSNLAYHKSVGMSLATGLNVAAGYNADNWFVGAGYRTGLGTVPASLSGADFYYDVTQLRVWAGTRFDWFKKKK